MNYDRTLLYSGASNVSSCTLSEPASAFTHLEIWGSDNVAHECTVKNNVGFYHIPLKTVSYYNSASYLVWPYSIAITNGTKTLSVSKFQLLYQIGTASPQLFGSTGNSANNLKAIKCVYGINRLNPVSTTGLGSPGAGWTEYNETLLWSGNNTQHETSLNLLYPVTAFERLKVRLGPTGATETNYSYDVGVPTTSASHLPMHSFWGNSTASNFYAVHRYQFSGYNTLLPVSGKAFQLGTAQQIPYTGSGNYTSTETFIRYPLNAIWGINRKV